MTGMDMTILLPHGACWLWDWTLITIHAIPDAVTFLAYMSIPLVLLYIYRTGHLKSLAIAYPRLWVLGMAFIFFCGLSHLGGVFEVWIGGTLYYWTGANKILMAFSSSWFAVELYRHRNEMATIGRVVSRYTHPTAGKEL